MSKNVTMRCDSKKGNFIKVPCGNSLTILLVHKNLSYQLNLSRQ